MREKDSTKPTLVCVHGAGGGGWEWAIWARVLATRGWSVLAPDLLPVAAGLAATRHADYRAQVLDWCRGISGPIALAGASLGGSLALSVASELELEAVLLVNPLVPRSQPAAPRPAVIPWRRRASLLGTRRAMSDADDAACLYASRRWRNESGAVLDEAEAMAQAEPPRCPTLVLSGERDADVPPSLARVLAIRIDADFVRLPGAGHLGPLLGRMAAATAEYAADWLAARVRAKKS